MIGFHPLANIFPLIEGAEFEQLVADMRAGGFRRDERIVILDGRILDGRNRYRAALAAGILGPDDIPQLRPEFCEFAVGEANPFDARTIHRGPLAFVISKNLHRRQLNESQRAMVAAKLAQLPSHRPAEKGANLHPSAEAAAGLLNVSERSVKTAKAVRRLGAPELQAAVEAGKVSVSAAETLTALPAAEQAEVVARGEKEILSVAKDIRARERVARFAERTEKLAAIAAGNREIDTSRRFPILLLDPATRFKSGFGDRSIENHYPTMPWDEIRALPIGELATDVAVMFCWTTIPHLANTLEAIRDWGFEYVSEWCWDKVDPGTGYWGFNQHEVLLIAKRGAFPAPLPGTQPRSLYREKKTDHSTKPAWFAEQIERIWPSLPKVELFARNVRPGWSGWGNQSDSQAKEPKADAGSTAGNQGPSGEVRVGEAHAGAPATSDNGRDSRRDGTSFASRVVDVLGDIPEFLRRRRPTEGAQS